MTLKREGESYDPEGLDIGCYSTGVADGESYDPEKGR